MSKEISNITEEMNSKIWKIQKTENCLEFIIRKHLHFNKKNKIPIILTFILHLI